jgi:hypothetical protein
VKPKFMENLCRRRRFWFLKTYQNADSRVNAGCRRPRFARVLAVPRQPSQRLAACLASALAAALLAAPASAESQLRLVAPEAFGTVPAATYDTSRNRVGDAHLVLEQLSDQRVRIFAESGYDGGARNVATALLEPAGDRRSLHPVLQESRTFLGDGSLRSTLSIDHRTRIATCGKANGDAMSFERIVLPASDRVANVALTLLFEPLVRGDAEALAFQLFLCEGGARLMDFEAHVERRDAGAHGPGSLVEIRYRPDLGSVGSLIAEHLIPQLSFWFDPKVPTPWLAHRLPLYSKGPEVMVVRDGVPTRWLVDEN